MIRTLVAIILPGCLAISMPEQEVIIPAPALNAVVRAAVQKPKSPLGRAI